MSSAPSLQDGSWGGEQVVLSVNGDKATLQLGCAQGEISGPILIDGQGRFSVAGTYTAFAGGPSTAAERALPARFEGTVTQGRLTLTVRHGETSETYQLTQGMQSKVIRCL